MSTCINNENAQEFRNEIADISLIFQPDSISEEQQLEGFFNEYVDTINKEIIKNPKFKEVVEDYTLQNLTALIKTSYGFYYMNQGGMPETFSNNSAIQEKLETIKEAFKEAKETDTLGAASNTHSHVYTLFEATGVSMEQVVEQDETPLEYEDLLTTSSSEFTEKLLGNQEALSIFFHDWLKKQMFKTLIFDQEKGEVIFEEDPKVLKDLVESFIENNKKYVEESIPEEKKKYFNAIMKGNISSEQTEVFTNWIINNGKQLGNVNSDFHNFMAYVFSQMPKSAINIYANTFAVATKKGIKIRQHINTRDEVTQDSEKINPLDNVPHMFKRLVENVRLTEFSDLKYDGMTVYSASLVHNFMKFDRDVNEELGDVMYDILYSDDVKFSVFRENNIVALNHIKSIFHGLFRRPSQLQQIKDNNLEPETWRLNKGSFFEGIQNINGSLMKKEELKNVSNAYLKIYSIKSSFLSTNFNANTGFIEEGSQNSLLKSSLVVDYFPRLIEFARDISVGVTVQSKQIDGKKTEIRGGLDMPFKDLNVTTVTSKLNDLLSVQDGKIADVMVALATTLNNGEALYPMELTSFAKVLENQRLTNPSSYAKFVKSLAEMIVYEHEQSQAEKKDTVETRRTKHRSFKNSINRFLPQIIYSGLNTEGKVSSSSKGFDGNLKPDYDLQNQQHAIRAKINRIQAKIDSGKENVFEFHPLVKEPNKLLGFELKEGVRNDKALQAYENLSLEDTFFANFRIWKSRKHLGKNTEGTISTPYASFADKTRAYNAMTQDISDGKVNLFLQEFYTKFVTEMHSRLSKVIDIPINENIEPSEKLAAIEQALANETRDSLMQKLKAVNNTLEYMYEPIELKEGIHFYEKDGKLGIKNTLKEEVRLGLKPKLLREKAVEDFIQGVKEDLKDLKDPYREILKDGEPTEEALEYANDFFNNFIMFSTLLQGISSQYKGDNFNSQFIDNVKRNVTLLSNYTPYFSSENGTANKSYVTHVKSSTVLVESIFGTYANLEQHDGAGFELINKSILNQVATGGMANGTPIGKTAAQKPFGTNYDEDQAVVSLDKNAIFAISNENIISSITEDVTIEDIINSELVNDC